MKIQIGYDMYERKLAVRIPGVGVLCAEEDLENIPHGMIELTRQELINLKKEIEKELEKAV